ncbi:hypothetical protein J7K97_06100, partial [Candidatus Aerophobetes bacterium]|nr:hypothetical protein [Candidatus Aerophobetes bacterium]
YTITYTISEYNSFLTGSTVTVTAEDAAGNKAITSTQVHLDNILPQFTSSTISDKNICRNTDEITLTCFLDASGYTVTADFSSIDSTYTSGEESVQDKGDGSYVITYTIGEQNTRVDGVYSIPVTAIDEAGNESVDADSGFSAQIELDNTPPQFLSSPRVGKFVDANSNNEIDEGEVNWDVNYFKNGDIVIIQTHLDSSGYATSGSVSANFLPLDTGYQKGEEQPPIPGDGSLPGGVLNLRDNLDNDQDGEINNLEEGSYYLIAYKISVTNTRVDGTYTIVLTATDSAGNSVTSGENNSATCKLDNGSPLIQDVYITLITQPTSPRSLKDVVAINEEITSLKVTFSDEEGSGVNIASSDVVLVAPDGSIIQGESITRGDDFIELSWSLNNLPLGDQGRYIVRVSVRDVAGNSADYTNYGFTYDTLSPYLAAITPADLSTLTSPLSCITAVISENTTQVTQVAGVDIENSLITLMDENKNVIASGGEPLDANTLKLEAAPGEYLAATSGFYFIQIKSVDWAGNVNIQTTGFSLQIDPVSGVVKASLDAGGQSVYDITQSTQPASCSCFANGKIDTIYVKVNLNQGVYLNRSSSFISLLKIEDVKTGIIQAEPVDGSSQVNYNAGEGSVEFFFYPESCFDPEKDNHAKDGFYWVKVGVADSSGNIQEISFFFVYDTTPPSPPEFSIKSFNSTTGVLTLDGTTSPDSSEPQWVKVYVNGVSKVTTQADENGDFSVKVNLTPGENSIALMAKDRAGNEGEFTSALKLTYNPQHLLSVVFRSSKILRKGSGTHPVKLVYYLTEPSEVTIRIYNLLGEIVYDWKGQVVPESEEEWSWWGENMFGDEVNNGIYILRIKAVSSTRSEVITKLVGVLR